MANKLIVPIIADSAAFKRGLKESETAATQFESKVKGSVSHVRSHILGLGAAFVGVGGLIEGLSKSVGAAEDLGKASRQLDAQLRANNESLQAIRPQLAGLDSQMAKLGFTNTQAEQAFTRLDRASGSSAAAFKYMGVTADLAAAKHLDLSQAALLVGKVMTGTTSALNRYGIAVPKGASATEALAIAQQKLAGQATAAVTPTEKFHAVLTNIEALIGEKLLPTVSRYLNQISDWLSRSENQRKVTDAVKTALHDLGLVLSALRDTFDRIWPVIVKVKNAFGDWKPLIVAAGAALVALGVMSPWTALAAGAVYVITHWEKVKVWFQDLWARLKAGFDILWDELKLGAYKAALDVVEPFSHLPAFLGGWARKAKDSLNNGLDAIQSDMGKNVGTITAAWGQAGKTAGDQWSDSLVHSLTANQARIAAAAGVTGNAASATADSRRQGGHSTGVTQGVYTQAQMAGLLVKAGATPQLAGILANIGHNYESGGRAGAVSGVNSNGTRDYGLFQINSSHGYSRADMLNPLQNAREALSIYHAQGFGAWTEAGGRAARAQYGNWLSMGSGGGASLPGDAAAAAAATKKAAAAAKAAASAAYKSWKENYFTPLDNQYKSDTLITDESKRLNKFEALHAKLAIDLKTATGKEHQDILNEETKVQGKIQSLRQKMANEQKTLLAREHAAYVKSLQSNLSAAQTALQAQQTLFDRAFGRVASKLTGALQAKYAAATPEEQARDAFQAQLDAAQKAADLSSAQNDLVAAQLAGDPQAVAAAQAHLDDVQNQQKLADLQDAATKSRAIQDAAGQTALNNLNDWLADQKTALETGAQTWDGFWQAAFSDAPEKYAPDAVSSLQGVLDQMARIKALQDAISGTSTPLPNVSTGLAGAYFMLNPQIPHFAAGGVMPGAYGQPGLAVLHGGETVTPVGAAQGGGDLYTTVVLDGQVVGRSVQKWAAQDILSGGAGVPG